MIEARNVERRFKDVVALRDVSFTVRAGEIHALLGSNGAGKTTLIRVLTGLQEPTKGDVRMRNIAQPVTSRAARQRMGVVPSGDRTFYNRISGFENLLFFARVSGLRRRVAAGRARELLAAVGLTDAADRAVGAYSHGMQKRLAVARGLLMSPELLFVDEATHDLDPEGADRVRELVKQVADAATGVVWTTQRVDEIRGFANRVTVLHRGEVRFLGSVAQLMSNSHCQRYWLQVVDDQGQPPSFPKMLASLAGVARVSPGEHGDLEHFLLELVPQASLSDAFARLHDIGLTVSGCTEERSEVEEALLRLTEVRRSR